MNKKDLIQGLIDYITYLSDSHSKGHITDKEYIAKVDDKLNEFNPVINKHNNVKKSRSFVSTKIETYDYMKVAFVELLKKKDFKTLERARIILADLSETISALEEDDRNVYFNLTTEEKLVGIVTEIVEIIKYFSDIYETKKIDGNKGDDV